MCATEGYSLWVPWFTYFLCPPLFSHVRGLGGMGQDLMEQVRCEGKPITFSVTTVASPGSGCQCVDFVIRICRIMLGNAKSVRGKIKILLFF